MFSLVFLLPFLGAVKSESYPPKLSDEMERKYLELMQKGDMNARNKLIEHNLRLVAHIAKKYDNINEDKDDILSIGIIGLIKGIDTFKLEHQSKLATYIARCIENEILMSIRSNKNKNNCAYLYSSIGEDKDGNEIELIDVIKDDSPSIMEELCHEDKISKLFEALSILNEREIDIINRRYGLNNTKIQTQKQIAHDLKISRSYVSRIEKRALIKLYLELLE
ncbi:MAG: RNA polymerase sporulation sigma factor SigK [Anaeroplasmataceae bacterium]